MIFQVGNGAGMTYGFRGDRVTNNGWEIGKESLRLFVEFLANGARGVLLLIRGVPNRYHVVGINLGAGQKKTRLDPMTIHSAVNGTD